MKMTTEVKMEFGLFVGTMALMVITLQPLL